MHEGCNIHYSPADNKLLCSFSTKLCKQRRLNGYGFCIRHILEDPAAPFKQCDYVLNAKSGPPQRCTNAIPTDKKQQYCNSHMQVMGIIPKKERKNKLKDRSPIVATETMPSFSLESRLKSRFSLSRNNSRFADSAMNDPDDPYAFPDTEPTPVAKSAVYSPGHLGIVMNNDPLSELTKPELNFSPAKMFPELAEKLIERTKSKPEPKGTKSSRTMNRLQTRIAQNILKDKQKRNQEFSSQGTTPEHQPGTPQTPVSQPFCVDNSQRFMLENRTKAMLGQTVHNLFPHQTMLGNLQVPLTGTGSGMQNAIQQHVIHQTRHGQSTGLAHYHSNNNRIQQHGNIPKSHTTRLRKPRGILSEVEVRKRLKNESAVNVYKYHAMKKAYNTDLLTFGPDDSDSDSDEDMLPWQHGWFSISSDEDCDEQEEYSRGTRKANVSLFKARLRRQFNQIDKSQQANVTMRMYDNNASKALILAAKESTGLARRAVQEIKREVSQTRRSDKYKRRGLEKRPCLYKNEEENVQCSSTALPYTNHCIKHVMYNVDQQLFEYCTGKFPDNSQCCTSIFDVLHEYPVCHQHSSQAVTLDSLPEVPIKKPRKKPKPLALLRPAKKKKKGQKKVRPQKPMPPTEPTGDTAMPVTPNLDTVAAHSSAMLNQSSMGVNDITKQLDDNSQDVFSPGAIDKSFDLPLDQESKLLEDHEFNDVLNKLPPGAFNDFFSGKNENGGNDDTSELEKAIAADISRETLDAITNDVMMQPDEQEEGELPTHIADEILDQEEDMKLGNIASSFSASDFKAISQTFNTPVSYINSGNGYFSQGHGNATGNHVSYNLTSFSSAPTIQALLLRPPMTAEHPGYHSNDPNMPQHMTGQHQYVNNLNPPQQFMPNLNVSPQRPTLHIPQHLNSPIHSNSPSGHTPSPHANSPHHIPSPMASPMTNFRPAWPNPERPMLPTSYQNGYPGNLPPYPQGSAKYSYVHQDGGYGSPTSQSYPAGTGSPYSTQVPHYTGLPPANS